MAPAPSFIILPKPTIAIQSGIDIGHFCPVDGSAAVTHLANSVTRFSAGNAVRSH